MRLKQVLLNLLSNAAKYGRPDSLVRLEAAAAGPGRVRLTVSDEGPGIAPELLDQLFKPFSRLGAERGTVEGAGIGLALSRQLMELMGGRIGVDSRPGEGADFWIELPASTLAAPPPPADAEAVASGWQALSESLVLYVEDNPANLALVEQIVARHSGIRLISAGDGAQGLAMARAQLPALILLDIHLPVMDGYELLARLRGDPLTRDIPVVAVTAQAMPSDARRAIQAGFDEYIAKPIDVSVFDTLLRRLLADAA
jgi:CheY-like chemotaxis protein